MVPARKTPSRMCGGAKIFIPEGAFRRRCLPSDDVELETLDRYLRLEAWRNNTYLATAKRDRIILHFATKFCQEFTKFMIVESNLCFHAIIQACAQVSSEAYDR